MGTGEIIVATYFGIAATCLIIGAMIGTWRAVAEWDDDWEEALLQAGGGIVGGMCAGIVWPLAIPMLIVAGPAWHIRNKRQQAETERRNTASALREAAKLYSRGSEEWHMLRKVADETIAGVN